MYNYYKIVDDNGLLSYGKYIDNYKCETVILSSSVNEYEHLITPYTHFLIGVRENNEVTEIDERVFMTKFNGIIALAERMTDPKVVPHYFVKGTNDRGHQVISKILSVTTDQGSKMIAKGLSIADDGTLMIIHMHGSFDEESCKTMLNGIPDEDLQKYHMIDEEDFITQFKEWIELTKKFIE